MNNIYRIVWLSDGHVDEYESSHEAALEAKELRDLGYDVIQDRDGDYVVTFGNEE